MRTKPAEQRRGELLDATERLVTERDTDAFTIEDVTTRAGVAKGTFYLHFANKSELLRALRERYVGRFVERQRVAAGEATGVESVERWLRTGVAEYLRDLRLHDVLFHPLERAGAEEPNAAVTALTALLAELRFPVQDPEATAVILYSAMHGAADHIVHNPDDERRILDALTRMCHTLVPTPGVGSDAHG
ncbi:TetR/AcrR family transcriptional regulator [Spiractinospora alimapuensis]|uniref:TetR/AcrR family transcriptional regulator n=1 Tax=Spiractinospora alimapuensis TaxID=2820884 RepID=UPI001F2E77EF|nr:TetR/AcrR family transcriptional regulator [Spiractinospora alimapuensis]QVQ52909.1 TetR/AcrR family transcriptional regulator [Spiractinospora alimapuensis]